jgi:chitin disaccharide deacetylase
VSRAIKRLIEAGRLTATNCMVTSRFWPEHAGWLRPLADRADIGLHLTLTDQAPLGLMPKTCPDGRLPGLRDLVTAIVTARLAREEIAAELERQLDAFTRVFGRPPAFLDGHQHVHELPVIRDAVLDLWRRRLREHGAWMRLCDEPVAAILRRGVSSPKALVVAALGWGLRSRARAAGTPTNDRFAGVREFSPDESYPKLFERYIAEPSLSGRLVVMCHPGEVDDELRAVDPVTDAREDELHFFESPEFPALLMRHGVALTRFS